MNESKPCTKCKAVKPLSEFWPMTVDGKVYRSHCKACHHSYSRTPQAVARVAAYAKVYAKSERGREPINKRAGKYRKKTPGRWAQYRSGAKKRGLEWALSKDEFLSFWGKPCFYCGDAVETIGLDRINASKGYTMVNVIPCCKWCNWMKQDRGALEFVAHVEQIVRHLKGYGAKIVDYRALPVAVKDYLWDYYQWETKDHVRKVL